MHGNGIADVNCDHAMEHSDGEAKEKKEKSNETLAAMEVGGLVT